MRPERVRNNVPDSLSISSSSVKVCKEFNWDVDDRDMEKARRKATAVDATGRKACAIRTDLQNMWRCMMKGSELRASDQVLNKCRQNKNTKVGQLKMNG